MARATDPGVDRRNRIVAPAPTRGNQRYSTAPSQISNNAADCRLPASIPRPYCFARRILGSIRVESPMPRLIKFCLALPYALKAGTAAAQAVTRALLGTAEDGQRGVLPGAGARVSSPALIGGARAGTTNETGQTRLPALPPGLYVLDIEAHGFGPDREEGIL